MGTHASLTISSSQSCKNSSALLFSIPLPPPRLQLPFSCTVCSPSCSLNASLCKGCWFAAILGKGEPFGAGMEPPVSNGFCMPRPSSGGATWSTRPLPPLPKIRTKVKEIWKHFAQLFHSPFPSPVFPVSSTASPSSKFYSQASVFPRRLWHPRRHRRWQLSRAACTAPLKARVGGMLCGGMLAAALSQAGRCCRRCNGGVSP